MNHIEKCLQALNNQITRYTFDVIVIDNSASSEALEKSLLNMRFDYKLLKSSTLNPYVSRNIGIDTSKSLTLGFLDAKCVPRPTWIEEALNVMLNEQNLILAGKYHVIPADSQIKNLTYGVMYLNNEKNTKHSYGITAGNFFAHRNVFRIVGNFPTQLKTGNDIIWSQKALLREDVLIKYSEKVVVEYPGQSFRKLKESVKKYAFGIVSAEQQKFNHFELILKGLRYFLPMKVSTFQEAIRYRNLVKLPLLKKFRLWLYVWQIKILLGAHFIKRI